MKKIMEAWDKGCAWLCSFGADRFLHLIVGLVFAVLVTAIMRATTPGCYVSAYAFMGVVGTAVLMILKELLDFFRGERFDGVDALFGVKLCDEKQSYTLARESYVAYKARSGGHFILAKQKAGTYIATNSTFGKDPQYGIGKEAYIVDIISRTTLPNGEAYTTTDGKLWTQL